MNECECCLPEPAIVITTSFVTALSYFLSVL
jgi:hypothetical protein